MAKRNPQLAVSHKICFFIFSDVTDNCKISSYFFWRQVFKGLLTLEDKYFITLNWIRERSL